MLFVYNMTDKYFINTCSGRQCFLIANQIVHLTKIRVVKSQVAMLVVSSATLKFVYVFLIQTNILPLITIQIKKKQNESCYQSKGDSSVLHWASCTAYKNHVIRQVSAHIPRTRYCFSINGPCKQAQCSLALERAGRPLFFIA